MASQYRHEFKYICSEAQIVQLQNRIRAVLPLDPHVGFQGMYQIRSLYFDDFEDRCYYENENGTDPREKFRIRIYNGNPDRISLELKRKENGKTQKLACPLTQAQCRALMAGQAPVPDPSHPAVLKKLLLLMRTSGMRPKVIVEYTRIPYVSKLGNTRITFDKNISTSSDISHFLDPEIWKKPIMEKGQHVLEVKFDEFLPDYIHSTLQMDNLFQTAFSKYYLCRKFINE